MLGPPVAVPVVFLSARPHSPVTDSSLENSSRIAGSSPLRCWAGCTVPICSSLAPQRSFWSSRSRSRRWRIPPRARVSSISLFIRHYLYNTWSNAFTPRPPCQRGSNRLSLCCVRALLRERLSGNQARFVIDRGRQRGGGVPPRYLRQGVALAGSSGSISSRRRSPPSRLWRCPRRLRVDALYRSLAPVTLGNCGRSTRDVRPVHPEHDRIRASVCLLTTVLVALAIGVGVAQAVAIQAAPSLPFMLLSTRAIPGSSS